MHPPSLLLNRSAQRFRIEKGTRMKRFMVIALIALVALTGWRAFTVYNPFDDRIYSYEQQSFPLSVVSDMLGMRHKSKLTFLYALDPSINKVLVYSPVIEGTMRVSGKIVQTDCTIDPEHTLTGNLSPCNHVVAETGTEKESFLHWIDAQGSYQQQFFTQGQIVFIMEQPLKMDEATNILLHVPVVVANASTN